MKFTEAFKTYPVKTIREILFKACHRYQDRAALKSKREGVFQPVTYSELRQRVEELSTCFFELGLEKGDRVAILGENRTEWVIAYLATVTAGMVAVPVDRDLKEREIRHILDFSGSKLLVVSDSHYIKVDEAIRTIPDLNLVISMDNAGGEGFTLSFREALDKGIEKLNANDLRYSETSIDPEDTASIIFTSGTTGTAKGVVLSHRNITENVLGVSFNLTVHYDIMLSVLPLHHTYESTAGMLTAIYHGATVCYAESLRKIVDNLVETEATVMLGVPALFEAIYKRIKAGIEEKGARKFALAKGIASISEKVFGISIRRKIFSQVHNKVGGHLRMFISGGAAVSPEVSKGFRDLGISFLQGYGLTEFSPIVAVNRMDAFKDGAAGIPVPSAEIKIVDDEILVKGPCVMLGYYKNKAATDEVLVDGWLHTGDLGYVDNEGFLFINGRRKSVIVTPNGKNVYPEEIEYILGESKFILESLVWGGVDQDPARTEVQAIIVPNTDGFDEEFGASNYDDEKMEAVIAQVVKSANKKLANYKRIKQFSLRSEEFEKTTTRKIKRYLYTAKTTPIDRKGS